MRILPIATNRYSGLSKLNSNNQKTSHFESEPVNNADVQFKGGKAMIGGFIGGVAGTIALSTVFPLAILGAGVAAIGGAIAGDKISDIGKKKA